MSSKKGSTTNGVMLRFLLGLLAIVAAVLGGIGINTVCGYGDLRVEVAKTATDCERNKEDLDKMEKTLERLEGMSAKVDRIAERLGIEEPDP